MKKGDILITNATSAKGITGHAAIANSDNYVLDMPGPSKKSKSDNNRQLLLKEWLSDYTSGWIRAYRLKDQRLAQQIGTYADRNFYSANGTSTKTVHMPYDVSTYHLYEKKPSYCSKLVFQSYYFGSGKVALMKPYSGFIGPYGLIRAINWQYRPAEYKVYR